MLSANLATLSQEYQVEQEKVQGLVMAMEVLSGVRACSAECDDLDSLLFCRKQELVAVKKSDWSTFYPEYNWGHGPFLVQAVIKAKVLSQRALTNCEEVSTWWQLNKTGVQMQPPAWAVAKFLVCQKLGCLAKSSVFSFPVQVTRRWALDGPLLWLMFSF